MRGAREYASLFESGQYGRLNIVSGAHARGKYFHIYVCPEGSGERVEVYGILGGRPGWTEYYGWLHHGQWEQDFYALVEHRKAEIAANTLAQAQAKREAEQAESRKVKQLLEAYR